jgi:hypothetical protein
VSRRSREPFLEGLTGRQLPSDSATLGETIRWMRDTLYAGRRDSTKAIAADLGYSTRQTRRLMAGEVKKPKADLVDRVNNEVRGNKQLRQAAVRQRPAPPAKGIRITISGNGGPVIGGVDYSNRPRPPITLALSPDQYERLRDAFAEGGGGAALDELNSNGDQYFEGFRWSKVDHMEIR